MLGAPLSKPRSFFLVILSLSFASCDGSESRSIDVQLSGLGDLGPGSTYEAWIASNQGTISVGRFAVSASDPQTSLELEADADAADNATQFLVTVEPAEGDDPAPSDSRVLAGDFVDGVATLTATHEDALGADLTQVTGSYVLETPTTNAIAEDFSQGVWFLDPAGAPDPSLNLPALAKGWTYEAWIIGDDGPVTTGRFASAIGADSDAAGPTAGVDGFPEFPGQDFINPPVDLIGTAAVITVEPDPDNSEDPFFLAPLADTNIENVGPQVLQSMENQADENPPSGIATIR